MGKEGWREEEGGRGRERESEGGGERTLPGPWTDS